MISDTFDLIVFDLDGTLVDSLEDLAASVNHALAGLDLAPLELSTVRSYVGNGARRLIERSLASRAVPDLLDDGLRRFLDHYASHCCQATPPYPEVLETLETLKGQGKDLAVLTNKPGRMTRDILESQDLARFFSRVVAGDDVPEKKPDPRGLLEIVAASGREPGKTLMVGDSGVDIEVARAASTHVAGVTYGFRPDEVRKLAPEFLLNSLGKLVV